MSDLLSPDDPAVLSAIEGMEAPSEDNESESFEKNGLLYTRISINGEMHEVPCGIDGVNPWSPQNPMPSAVSQ